MVVQKKINYVNKLSNQLSIFDKALIVNADNVTSKQIQTIRGSLRGVAEICLGKNTLMKYVINRDKEANPDAVRLIPHLKNNVGFVFTNGDLNEVKEALLSQKVQAPAKADALAPTDVTVPKQVTTLGPEKTSFFQALQIPTKITRGTIEIINDVELIKAGNVVKQSESQLLQMLKIFPFEYGFKITQIFENGSCYSPEALDITESDILESLMSSIANVAAVSLALDIPTLASVPHIIVNTMKSLIALSVETDYDMEAARDIKEFLKDPTKFATVAAPAVIAETAAKTAPKVEEKPVSESESDSDVGMGMFD